MHWVTPQMPTAAKAGPGGSQEPRESTRLGSRVPCPRRFRCFLKEAGVSVLVSQRARLKGTCLQDTGVSFSPWL